MYLLGLKTRKSPWWVKINTKTPNCIYYFGPFNNYPEAKQARSGYIEDLVREKALGITVEIKQCQPKTLTVFSESKKVESRIAQHAS